MRLFARRAFTPIALAQPSWLIVVPVLWILLLALTPHQSLTRDLWTDEAFTMSYTAHSSLTMVLDDVRKNEETPPVYFIIAWAWSRIAGQSEVALRLLSLLFGGLAVTVLVLAARRWLPARDAAFTGYFLAILTPLGFYLVTARSYALMLLMAVIAIAAFERLYRNPDHRFARIGYGLAMAIFCLTSYFAAAFVVAHNLIWFAMLIRQRKAWRQFVSWLFVQIGIGAAFLPWLPAFLYQFKTAHFVTSTTEITAVEYFWQAYSLMAVPPASSHRLLIWLPLTVLCWALIAIGLRNSGKGDTGLVVRVFGVPAIVQLTIVILLEAAAWRYLTILLPGAVLAGVVGLATLRRQMPQLALIAQVVLTLGMLGYRMVGVSGPNIARAWPELMSIVQQQANPMRDSVLLHPPWEQRTFEYYYRGPALTLHGAHNYDDFFMRAGHNFHMPWTTQEVLGATAGSHRIWVFYYQTAGVQPLQLPYRVIDRWRSGKLELVLYAVSP